MARRDARSPSPAGSTYSRRERRGDDRYDPRDRRRTRSRSPERRSYYDRDRGARKPRDRSIDRRGDRREDRWDGRRDRDRDRRRERSPLRGRRDRSRDRNTRDKRDDYDNRDGARQRRDGTAEADRKKPETGRLAPEKTNGSTPVSAPSPTTDPNAAAKDKKTQEERLAKIAAWKKAAEEKKKKKAEEEQRKAEAASTGASTPAPTTPAAEESSPVPYAGKFDPKAIAKKANEKTSAMSSKALGADVAIPVNQKSGIAKGINGIANKQKSGLLGSRAAPQGSLKANTKVSGFGFASKISINTDKGGNNRALGLGDEEVTTRKLEKLPTPPLDDGAQDDATLANDEEDDDDVDLADIGTEEEIAAAARAAAEKRAERLQEQNRTDAQTNEDVAMADAPAPAQAADTHVDENEELDPLDAFMNSLSDAKPKPKQVLGKRKMEPEPDSAEINMKDEDNDDETLGDNPNDILAMAAKKKKKNDIPTVDHSKMNYEPFRKAFYSEPTEVAGMTQAEVDNLRHELGGIIVRGVNVPKPVTKWAQCGLGVQTLDVIKHLGYEAPTSIQAQAIPAIMAGRDIIGVAKTGSGKTIAFLLPMFRHIKDQRPLANLDGPIGVVMTPTRELATQIHRECKPFLKALGLRAVCAYGGAPIREQIAELKRGAEIVVCTPGRMIDLLAANQGRVTNLQRVTYIVLDEADRMFDMGFEPQVMKILANVRPDRQTVLFSATFPRNMESLARKALSTKPLEIVVGGKSVVAKEITQIVEVRSEDTKFIRLLELLGQLYETDEDARTLIFTEKQESADNLVAELLRKGYPCQSIHGGKEQYDRDASIQDFKAGHVPILVATSVAARGLDVKQLKLVVNYDAPNHLEDYVHRAGRTGRAGNTGTAVTFITEDQERYAVGIAKALEESEQPVPEAVQKLVTSFKEKVAAGTEKAAGSGFGGKGLEVLDQHREASKAHQRRAYKTGDDDEDDKDEGKAKDDQAALDAVMAKATGQVKARDNTPAAATSSNQVNPNIPKGIDLDNFVIHKTEKPDPAAESNDPLAKVRAAIGNITDRLTAKGSLRPGQPIDNKGPDAGAFHATLEINDFPQKARWAVTNRTNVAKILEATGTSITTKGNFYAAGKEPGPNEAPKLYILVEGDTEVVVRNAMMELARLLKEGTSAAIDSESRAPASGRYSVL